MPIDGPDRRFMAMPAYLGGDYQVAGCKWYGSNVENKQLGLPRSILMFTLNDRDTGARLAIMSANLLSAYRTRAIPGVGARYLAREDARVVGIVGPAPMNRTSLESFLAVRPGIETVKVAGCGQAAVDIFIAWVRDGRMTPEQFEDVGEIIEGLATCRWNEDEIFIYSVGGMPVEDVAWATKVYRNALERGIGTKLNLWKKPALA